MRQTKPLFIIRKYRSSLRAAIVVEAVNYLVSLTDTLVAGNALGSAALAAVGLIAPFLSLSVFLSSVVNAGTAMQYTYQIGRFDKRRALEFSSQGILLAILAGAAYAGLLFASRDLILPHIAASEEIRLYARQYLSIMVLSFLMDPVSYVLDNLVTADGGEKLSAFANIVLICANVLLSILFVGRWGIRGVAAASVLSDVLFLLIISVHFLRKTNTLRLIRRWSGGDCAVILRSGIVKASDHALEALTTIVVNLFAVSYFDSDTLVLLVMVERFLGLQSLFIGLAMAAQTLIGTLNGEGNRKALYELMKTVCRDMIAAGAVLTVLTLCFTPLLVRAFGITDEALLAQGVIALRIVSATLVLHAVLVLFFIYYYLLDRQLLAFILCLFRNVISPLLLAVLLSLLTGSRIGMWIGLAAAPILSAAVCGGIVYGRHRAEVFPFLIPRGADDNIFIYDFEIGPEAAADLSKTADEVLRGFSVSDRVRYFVGLFIEEELLLVREKNTGRIDAECTIIVQKDGVRLILRDTGRIFDITDEDAAADSFRQYIVGNLMLVQENKAYLTTSGYNRNELFFPEAVEGIRS